MSEPLEIIIVGGGTAGWMSAVALANFANPKICNITLIESEDIGTVGVGEATLPQMKEFNDHIGINEADMMRHTNATFKLGIEFVNWGKIGNSYIHPFGKFGGADGGVDFHQLWARVRNHAKVNDIGRYSYAVTACRQNRFEFPVGDQNYINSTYAYAYHFDASLYARYLRRLAEAKLVKRIEGKIQHVINNQSGFISEVQLENGQRIKGDFFIDCSGFKSLLLGQHFKSEFDDWSKWLVCDRALAAPSENNNVLNPYTRSTAQAAGWQWKIPLQSRTGNGYVFCSHYMNDDEAAASLISNLDTAILAEPKLLKFKAGRYKKSWEKNCLAIGLSSGFLEPLESTSIYLIQVAIFNFLKLFPSRGANDELIQEYNRLIDCEYERIRDFLILHYHLNQREDGELWRYCRNMDIPESLKQKMHIFKHRGFIDAYKYGLFAPPSWISVFTGQDYFQKGTDPFAMNLSDDDVIKSLRMLDEKISRRVDQAPTHEEFIKSYCAIKL